MESSCNSYLPIYTETTFQLNSIKTRQKQRRTKNIQKLALIFLAILLIFLACFGLYVWLFNESSLDEIPGTLGTISITETTSSQENTSIVDNEDYPEDIPSTNEPTIKRIIHKFNTNHCGQISIVKKVQNGEFAHLNEFPWVVALYYLNTSTKNATPMYGCGGSLISDDLILTAGHCLVEKKDLVL